MLKLSLGSLFFVYLSPTTTFVPQPQTYCHTLRRTQIRPSDGKNLWNKMLQVRTIVDKELGFVPQKSVSQQKDCPWTTYLYISSTQQRVVGLLSAELIRKAFSLHDNNCERSTHARKAMLGIHTIWVGMPFPNVGERIMCNASHISDVF